MSSAGFLLPYQLAYLEDPARLKLWVKSRRIGGSFTAALDVAWAAAGFGFRHGRFDFDPDEGRNQFVVSAGRVQAESFVGEVRTHLEALGVAAETELVSAGGNKQTLLLRNGRKVRAMAANPRTIRSYEGDVTLDEYGVMPAQKRIWAAAKAVADRTLRSRRGYRIRILGTPLGDDSHFYRLAETDEGARFSRHRTTIWEAISQGFPANGTELRDEIGDSEIFAQEYECSFLAASSRYISAELFDRCLIKDDLPVEPGGGYAGMDVAWGQGAKAHRSAIVEVFRAVDTLWTADVQARQGLSWDEQEAWVSDVMTRRSKLALDATSMGSQFGVKLTRKHGESRIQSVQFTSASKEALATGLRLGFELNRLRVPLDPELRRDVLSIRRVITTAGNVKFDAEVSKHGHGDRAWALALAVQAAGGVARGAARRAGVATGIGSEAHAAGQVM